METHENHKEIEKATSQVLRGLPTKKDVKHCFKCKKELINCITNQPDVYFTGFCKKCCIWYHLTILEDDELKNLEDNNKDLKE